MFIIQNVKKINIYIYILLINKYFYFYKDFMPSSTTFNILINEPPIPG